jgi:hypothetical protein
LHGKGSALERSRSANVAGVGDGEADGEAEAEGDEEADGSGVAEGLGEGSGGTGTTQNVRFVTSIFNASFASSAFARFSKHPIRSPVGAVKQ